MKKIDLFKIIAVLSLISFLTSCLPKPIPSPNITHVQIQLNPTIITVFPGSNITISWTIISDSINNGELGDFTIRDENETTLFKESYSNLNKKSGTFDYTVPTDVEEWKEIPIIFEAIDGKSGKSTIRVAGITIKPSHIIVEADNITSSYVSTTLTNSMIFDLGTDAVEMKGGDFADGELAFVWQNTYGYCVASPNASWIADLYDYNSITYTTSDKQTTKIQKYTAGTWASLDQETINDLSITTETLTGGGNGVEGLNSGDIIVFETQDGRKGALKVNTNSKVTKNMNCDVHYQATGTAGK